MCATDLSELTLKCQRQQIQKDQGEKLGADVTNNQAMNGDQRCVVRHAMKHKMSHEMNQQRSHHGEPTNSVTLQGLLDPALAGNQLESMGIVNISGMNYGAIILGLKMKMIFGMSLHLVNGSSGSISDLYFNEENT